MTIFKVFPFWPCNCNRPSKGCVQKRNSNKIVKFLTVTALICFIPRSWGLLRTDVIPEGDNQVNLSRDYGEADRLIPHDHVYDHDNDDATLFQEIHQGLGQPQIQ